MIDQVTRYLRLRWVVLLLLSLLWATMGGAVALPERGNFGRCGFAANKLGYRAVSKAELDDIAENGFRPHPEGRSMQDKWFSESRAGAEAFQKTYPELEHVVAAKVPKSVYDASHKHSNIDQTGPGFAVPAELQPQLKPKLP